MLKVAVVIPTHKEELNPLEKISLEQCRKVLGRYPIIFALPEGKNFSFLEPNDKVVYFPQQCFQSIRAYNVLMMSPFFYEAFKDFEYILIHELDAFVFYDVLENFCSLGYDYIGAPWPLMYRKHWRKMISCVGNSGFCLRKVKAHYNLLIHHSDLVAQWLKNNSPEDIFFSHCGKRTDCNFNVAPIDIAYKFSAEYNPARVIKKNGNKIPFGCHAWHKHSPEVYTKIFQQIGYDLRPLRNLMIDADSGLNNWLINAAMQRLIRRLQRGKSIMSYLPTKRFASVRVIRHPFAMMILTRLLMEDSSLSDKIFLYTPDEQDILLQDLSLKKLPHLLITEGATVDASLIAAVEKKGFAYGKRVVSFHREYLNRCAELFRKLGK